MSFEIENFLLKIHVTISWSQKANNETRANFEWKQIIQQPEPTETTAAKCATKNKKQI